MVATNRVTAIFADARGVHADALRLLESGDIRDAAEKGVVRHQAGHRCPDPGPHWRGT